MAENRGKKIFGYILSFGISGGILVYLGLKLDWPALMREIQRVQLVYMIPLALLLALQFVVRGIRWKLLLPSSSRTVSVNRLTEATLVGALAACVLPLRAGEFVRPWILSRWQSEVKFSSAFASIVTERVFDVLALMVLIFVAVQRVPSIPGEALLAAKSLGFLSLIIILVMLFAYVKPTLFARITENLLGVVLRGKYPSLVAKIRVMLDEFVEGLRGISGFGELLMVVLWSLVLWGLYAFSYQLALWGFGENPSYLVGVMTTIMIALAVAAPSGPAFIGTLQAGCVIALSTIYAYPWEFAIAYSIVVHAMSIFVTCLLGLLVLHYEGLSFREVTSEAEKKAH